MSGRRFLATVKWPRTAFHKASSCLLESQDLGFFAFKFGLGQDTCHAKFTQLLELGQLVVGEVHGSRRASGRRHRCRKLLSGRCCVCCCSILSSELQLLFALDATHHGACHSCTSGSPKKSHNMLPSRKVNCQCSNHTVPEFHGSQEMPITYQCCFRNTKASSGFYLHQRESPSSLEVLLVVKEPWRGIPWCAPAADCRRGPRACRIHRPRRRP